MKKIFLIVLMGFALSVNAQEFKFRTSSDDAPKIKGESEAQEVATPENVDCKFESVETSSGPAFVTVIGKCKDSVWENSRSVTSDTWKGWREIPMQKRPAELD